MWGVLRPFLSCPFWLVMVERDVKRGIKRDKKGQKGTKRDKKGQKGTKKLTYSAKSKLTDHIFETSQRLL